MTSIALLAELQDRYGLAQVGAAELKGVHALEELLDGEQHSADLPFAIAAFLLDDAAVSAAITDGLVAGNIAWSTAARKPNNLEQHWRPNRHTHVPSTVIRALGIAEQVRCFWIAMNNENADRRGRVDMIRALSQEWIKNDPLVPARLPTVVDEIANTPPPIPLPASSAPDWLISVSIDVAGSTEAKTRLQNLKTPPDRQRDFLQLFYGQFLNSELRFYDHLTRSDHSRPFLPIALEQIFYVKGIGDEVWLLIEPKAFDREHLLHLLILLLNAVQAALSNPISFAVTAIEEGPVFDPVESERAIMSGVAQLHLPFKVFIDKVDWAYPISGQRAGALLPWLNGAVSDGRIVNRDFANIANRIGAGSGALTAGTWRNATRTDYIGHEIDRLFRAAKAAKPLLTTVGANLMHAVDPDIALLKDRQSSDRPFMVRCDPRTPVASRGIIYSIRPETVPAAEMKGIEYDYRVYHFFDAAWLRGQYAHADNVKRLAEENLPPGGFDSPQLPQFVKDMEKLRTFMNDPPSSIHPPLDHVGRAHGSFGGWLDKRCIQWLVGAVSVLGLLLFALKYF